MDKAEMIYLATKCQSKGWTYEQLYYGDDLYDKEEFADNIWEYVIELEEIGYIAFKEKYKEFKMY